MCFLLYSPLSSDYHWKYLFAIVRAPIDIEGSLCSSLSKFTWKYILQSHRNSALRTGNIPFFEENMGERIPAISIGRI